MGKNKGGRPSKYDSKYCEELIKFFDIEPYTDIDIPHMDKDGAFRWMDSKRVANRLPTVRNFCKVIKISFDTFYEWVKVHKEFSDAFTHAKDLQKWFLIENGLNGTYNPTFAIFTAKNISDMRDVQAVQHTGQDDGPIEIRIIEDKRNNNNE